jgi:hypothetical protein
MGGIEAAAIVVVALALLLTGPSWVYTVVTGRIPRFPFGPRWMTPMTDLGNRLIGIGNLLTLAAIFSLLLDNALVSNGHLSWWYLFFPAAAIAGAVISFFAWMTQRLPPAGPPKDAIR